jgi:hypothetical protein
MVFVAIVVLLGLRRDQARPLPHRPLHRDQGVAGEDLRPDRRLPQVGRLVALREARPGHDPHLWRPHQRPGLDLRLERQRQGRGRAHGDRRGAAPSKLVTSLDFTKPFQAHNKAIFTLVPEGDATRVTWAMEGPSPYLFKVMDVIFNMDRMAGKDFETGLTSLKAEAEQ